MPDHSKLSEQLKLAELYFSSRKFTHAELILNGILSQDQNISRANELLAYIYNNYGKHDDAYRLLNLACDSNDCTPQALYHLGSLQLQSNQLHDAIKNLNRAVEKANNFFEAIHDLAVAYAELGLSDKALEQYSLCININPNSYELHFNIARTFDDTRQFDQSVVHYKKALEIQPNASEAWSNLGASYNDLGKYEDALSCQNKALQLKPGFIQAWLNKGVSLSLLKRHSEAADSFENSYRLSKLPYHLSLAHHQRMLACDWSNYESTIKKLITSVDQENCALEPFGIQGIFTSEKLIKKCLELYTKEKFPNLNFDSKPRKYEHKKIKIAYLSGEFRQQATSVLMARIWELHDKSTFETFALDNGWDDSSEYRTRITSAFDHIIPIRELSDYQAAKLILNNEIDILVNLNGYFGANRQAIFSYRPAPVQINYLGFPGTLGANYIDYIIADSTVIPESSRDFYTEKIIYMPNCYQANDNLREISERSFTKSELGLPEESTIFACFNNNYKITPQSFKLWAKILHKVPNSCLWLLGDNPDSKKNLLKTASEYKITKDRIIFAERMPPTEHLARQKLADIFLDTLPYNAHTTASDALWAGLPVITLLGSTFPGRVSASLLKAVGLNELITTTEDEFIELASNLANNPRKLLELKQKLRSNIPTSPLFDSEKFCRDLEHAFKKVHERRKLNLSPINIFI